MSFRRIQCVVTQLALLRHDSSGGVRAAKHRSVPAPGERPPPPPLQALRSIPVVSCQPRTPIILDAARPRRRGSPLDAGDAEINLAPVGHRAMEGGTIGIVFLVQRLQGGHIEADSPPLVHGSASAKLGLVATQAPHMAWAKAGSASWGTVQGRLEAHGRRCGCAHPTFRFQLQAVHLNSSLTHLTGSDALNHANTMSTGTSAYHGARFPCCRGERAGGAGGAGCRTEGVRGTKSCRIYRQFSGSSAPRAKP